MPKIFNVEDTKPKAGLVEDIKPKMSLVDDVKPKMTEVHSETQIYYSGGAGQPMGLLLTLTYPSRI